MFEIDNHSWFVFRMTDGGGEVALRNLFPDLFLITEDKYACLLLTQVFQGDSVLESQVCEMVSTLGIGIGCFSF